MTLVTRPIPGLFGGVSQQIPAMRHPTNCEQQDNGLATLVDGLYKRDGSHHVSLLQLSGPGSSSVQASYGAAYGHVIDKASAGRYMLTLVNGNLMLYSMENGAAQTVIFPDGLAYLNTPNPEQDFRCVTVADYTFIINKSKTVALKPATDSANPTNVAFINVRTAVPSITYTVDLDGTVVTVTSTATPTNASIATQLRAALITAFPGYLFELVPDCNVIKVTRTGSPVTCKVSDGWANTALQCVSNGVPKYSDLPPAFLEGFVVTITGTADSIKDQYYVQWKDNRWVECKQPTLQDTFDDTTMPHQLRPDGSGGWVFERAVWAKRLVGDENTNPAPSFVGSTMRGVFFFRNRLGFLSADNLVLSRSGDYFNFWGSTATQVLDTDPIDLSSTAAEVETLDWTVVYNQTLLVFAASKQQFTLTSGDVLSPNTARLMPTTTFESFNGSGPVALGNKVLFASTAGSHTQLSLYRVAQDRVTNVTDDLTEHVPRYIPKEPRAIEASTVTKMAVMVPQGLSKELYVFKYEVGDDDKLTQKAWQRFIFETPEPLRIIKAYWSSRRLYLLTHRVVAGDIIPGGRFALSYIDFEEDVQDENAGISLRLDERVKMNYVSTAGSTSTMSLPYAADVTGMKFLLCRNGEEPVSLTPVSSTINTTTMVTNVVLPGNLTGLTVWAGRPFTFRYTFTEVFFRDSNGVPVMASKLKLIRMIVRYVKTGWFKAIVEPYLRGSFTYPLTGRDVGVPGEGATMLGLSKGELSIPVQFKAKDATVTLESDSYLPCSFPYAEWVGDLEMKAQR